MQVESAKRYNFLEMVVLVVFSHMKFFEQGHCSLNRLTAATNDALEIVDHLRKEQTIRSVSWGDQDGLGLLLQGPGAGA